jgi:hypothetical protein
MRRAFRFPLAVLCLGLAAWTLATWPLPRRFAEAIPIRPAHAPSEQALLPFTPADAAQLLFHFWLGGETLSGRIPPMTNPYEFNVSGGNGDAAGDLHYLPFSLVANAVSPLAGPAAGYNAAALASYLLAVFFLALLARAVSKNNAAALAAALVAATLPASFIPLLHGSPTGFALAFPPAIAWGLVQAVSTGKRRYAVAAGAACCAAYLADLHVFYFVSLALPLFFLLALALASPLPSFRGLFRSLLPFAACFAGTLVLAFFLSARSLARTSLAAGRSLTEASAFSLLPDGFFDPAAASPLFLGSALVALLALAAAFSLLFRRRYAPDAPRVPWAAVLLAAAAVALLAMLALGAHGPKDGLVLRAARKLVPKFTMLRQTAKGLCLLPTLMAVTLAALLSPLFAKKEKSEKPATRARGAVLPLTRLLAAVLVLCAAGGNLLVLSPVLSRIPSASPVYAAVAADTPAGETPRALALPLWPGESHFSSAYEMGSMLSRVRLVNGYAPAPPAGYADDVFRRFEALNQGRATDEDLDTLLALGVKHLILHAETFPAKVSPWPPAATLRALRANPRLEPFADDGRTFAFRILETPDAEAAAARENWPGDFFFPFLHWKLAPDADGVARLPLRAPVAEAPDLRFLVYDPDGGTALVAGEGVEFEPTAPVEGLPGWCEGPCRDPAHGAKLVGATAQTKEAFLAAGELPKPGPDGAYHFAPAMLWHAGKIVPGKPEVTFTPEENPAGQALFGPHFPLPAGTYEATLRYEFLPTEKPEKIGFSTVRLLEWPMGGARSGEWILDPANDTATLPPLELSGTSPIRLELDYFPSAPLVLRDFALKPVR